MYSVAGFRAIYWNAWTLQALSQMLINSFLVRHLATPATKTCRYYPGKQRPLLGNTGLLALPIQPLRTKLMTSVKCFLPAAHTEA
jgi:hypothetical protein